MNTDFLNPAACNTKPTEIEPKASMTADTIQKHKTAHLWHLVCWKWFWSFIRTLVMTKLSGFILVDKLSTVFQFIFCTRNRSIYSSVFLEDL